MVELRYFVGLSIEETAKALESSPATVKREWTDCARVASPGAHDGVSLSFRASVAPSRNPDEGIRDDGDPRWLGAGSAPSAGTRSRRSSPTPSSCPPAERAAFVAEACGSDAELRTEVESLLAAHDGDADFLEAPLIRPPTANAGCSASGCRLR